MNQMLRLTTRHMTIWRFLYFVIVVLSAAPRQTSGAITPGSKDIGAIWFVGDSITQGNADGDSAGGMRATLYNSLTASNYTFTYTGHSTANPEGLPTSGSGTSGNLYQYHSGVSGAVIATNITLGGAGRTGISQNITNWWTNSTSRVSVVKPNVILLMIGANDCYFSVDVTNAPARLSQLINVIYNQPGVGNPTIFVAVITPDRSTNMLAASNNVAIYNAGIPSVVQSFQTLGKDVYLVDQFTALNNNFNNTMVVDGTLNLHPNAVGNTLMASNWFSAIQGYVGVTVTPPPYGLSATNGSRTISLSWNPVAGATNGYNLKRSLASGGPYTTVATNVKSTGYIDTSVTNLSSYFYVVTASNAKGQSPNSNEAVATPLPVTTPFNLVCNSAGGTLNLSWPADHQGWTLQTNAIGLTATNGWFPYPGSSSATNVSIPIITFKTNVFFRMRYP